MKRLFLILLVFVMLPLSLLGQWPFSSGKEYRMTSGKSVPAATGVVKVRQDKDNGNTKLEIKVEHLADPSRLTPAANSYLVWIRPRGVDAIRQGAIKVNKDLKGELNIVTVSKDFEVFITAEQSESASFPSDVDVLRAHVNAN